jgi:hypothetical protein
MAFGQTETRPWLEIHSFSNAASPLGANGSFWPETTTRYA